LAIVFILVNDRELLSAEVGLIGLAPAYAWPNSGQPRSSAASTGAGDPVVTAAPFIAICRLLDAPLRRDMTRVLSIL
jgi:hypothetical protein